MDELHHSYKVSGSRLAQLAATGPILVWASMTMWHCSAIVGLTFCSTVSHEYRKAPQRCVKAFGTVSASRGRVTWALGRPV